MLIPTPDPKQDKNAPEQPPQQKAGGLEGPDVRAQGLLTDAGRVPATVRQVLQFDVGASFPAGPEDESRAGVRDDAGVRAAEKWWRSTG